MERKKVVVQIVAMMILIFLAGGWAGWTLGRAQQPLSSAPGPGGARLRQPNADRLLRELKQQLKLTPEQETRLDPILGEWAKAAGGVEQARLKDRRELFRKYAPTIRSYLTPDQQTQYDRMTRKVEAFQERRISP